MASTTRNTRTNSGAAKRWAFGFTGAALSAAVLFGGLPPKQASAATVSAAEAANTTVSDLESYWADIDTARAGYRAAMANGLVALSILSQWDEGGAVASDLKTHAKDSTGTVQELYNCGVGIEQATARSQGVASIGGSYYLAADLTPGNDESWQAVGYKQGELAPVLQAMAAGYDPAANDGQSLEEHLVQRGIPTRVNYQDSFYIYGQGSPVHYDVKAVQGRIVGNDYEQDEVLFWRSGITTEIQDKSFVQDIMAAAKARLSGQVALQTSDIPPSSDEAGAQSSVLCYVHERDGGSIVAPGSYEPVDTRDWHSVSYTTDELLGAGVAGCRLPGQ